MHPRVAHDDGNDDYDLGLSLSLKCPAPKSPSPILPINNIPFQFPSASGPSKFQGKTCTTNNVLAFDINKLPAGAVFEPVPLTTVSSPDSIISDSSRKRTKIEENESEKYLTNSAGASADTSLARKKLKLSKEQAAVLEETFNYQPTLSQNEKVALAMQLNLDARQVEVWFQNRRARTKLKKTEVEYVVMKRLCENLSEENRRLREELAELRAVKYSSQKRPTILNMCPDCKHMSMLPKQSHTSSSTTQDATGTSSWLINCLHETTLPRP